eukprot:TRINITY_DN40623_c0_g1_i1.p1 TRINITY_DN40623_c0_g1~~TRINITY_DN40623_c0_g1_i1.p1  ORF type:complete len:185 (-),score=49.91 TRINITY_DN40623_c0_g1_i1:13-567(-)
MELLDFGENTTLVGAALVAVALIAAVAVKGPAMLAGLRKSLLELGLSSEVMARSLALGFMFGTFPVYVPTVPTLIIAAVAKVLGLSVPATILGLNIATPFFMSFMVPFIRAGEWLGGEEPLAIDTLMTTMKASVLQGFQTFGGRLLMGALAWSVAAPFLLVLSYLVFRPLCKVIQGEEAESKQK